MRNELFKILFFKGSKLRFINVLKTVDNPFYILNQNIITSDHNFLLRFRIRVIWYVLFVLKLCSWIPLSAHTIVQLKLESFSKDVVFKQEFVDKSLNLFLVLKELLVIVTSSCWKNSYKISFSFIFKYSFK